MKYPSKKIDSHICICLQDDPEAHERFIRINRAYEVLKDDELRKKYDTFGEEGLKEDAPSGGGYRSWKFYNQEFGLYDDDAAIITLSKSDFGMEISKVFYFLHFGSVFHIEVRLARCF